MSTHGVLFYRIRHREPVERLCKRDRGILEFDFVRAVDLLHEARKEVLGEPHHVIDIVVRPVDLHHRELGVVVGIDVLVTEIPCDLKDPFETADNEALEVEFGRYSQEELLAKAVVERGERPGVCPAVYRLEDRCLELEKIPVIQEPPDGGEDPAPAPESLPGSPRLRSGRRTAAGSVSPHR